MVPAGGSTGGSAVSLAISRQRAICAELAVVVDTIDDHGYFAQKRNKLLKILDRELKKLVDLYVDELPPEPPLISSFLPLGAREDREPA
jgi:hypothetical protein